MTVYDAPIDAAMAREFRREEIPLSKRGPAETRVVVGFGFWLFLLERHRHLRLALRRLCRAVAPHRGRAERKPALRPRPRR